jgi:hypothetical protein
MTRQAFLTTPVVLQLAPVSFVVLSLVLIGLAGGVS